MANSSNISKPGSSNVEFTVQNWYSPACVANWAVMTWPRSNRAAFVEIHTKDWAHPAPSAQRQPAMLPDELCRYAYGRLRQAEGIPLREDERERGPLIVLQESLMKLYAEVRRELRVPHADEAYREPDEWIGP